MFFITCIATGMTVGSMFGSAIATAVGSLTGAGVGFVTGVRESWDAIAYRFL